MQVRVLGAAAGGGFPQWNCSCSNCRRLRQDRFPGKARSQAQLAVSTDGLQWILLNASPDLRYQIESFPPLHPHASSLRNSPLAGIVLPSAELDAALGLLLLRESQPLTVYATDSVRELLTEDNAIFGVLRRQTDQVRWVAAQPGVPFLLGTSGIECLAVSADGGFPGFVPQRRAAQLPESEAVLGLFLSHNSKRLAFFPGAAQVRPEWFEQMKTCDLILFDGTFWSDDELIASQGDSKTARQMGHHPVSETLSALGSLAARKVFIHINNTNPILDEESEEYRFTRDAGWEIAFDGMDLSL